MATVAVPDRTEAAEYYFTYIDKVAERSDICSLLEEQLPETLRLLQGISDEKSLYRYAPDKWSIRESLSHINDAERIFLSRAFWFARGFKEPLPSFDQDVAVASAKADERAWSSHIEEFQTVRQSSVSFFRSVSDEAWTRRGIASGNPFTVRALAYIVAGHLEHHVRIFHERYL